MGDRAELLPASRARRRIMLIGMMGAGKSTIGRALAMRTGWPYVDNDELVEEATGRTPADLIESEGEDALHRAERAAFWLGASLEPPVIVGVAGAVVLDPDAQKALRAASDVIWLRASPGLLTRRIGRGSGRRRDAEAPRWIAEATAAREASYHSAADLVIDVDGTSPDEIVELILATPPNAAT